MSVSIATMGYFTAQSCLPEQGIGGEGGGYYEEVRKKPIVIVSRVETKKKKPTIEITGVETI
jgi:hypothetical protein